jgi:hypothetical protein
MTIWHMSPTSRTFLGRALRRSLGAIFLAAAVGKLLAIRHGQSNDLFQAIIGLSVAPRVGICAGEALLGIWLISGRWPELSAVVTLVLCSGFLGVLGSEGVMGPSAASGSSKTTQPVQAGSRAGCTAGTAASTATMAGTISITMAVALFILRATATYATAEPGRIRNDSVNV